MPNEIPLPKAAIRRSVRAQERAETAVIEAANLPVFPFKDDNFETVGVEVGLVKPIEICSWEELAKQYSQRER